MFNNNLAFAFERKGGGGRGASIDEYKLRSSFEPSMNCTEFIHRERDPVSFGENVLLRYPLDV